MTTLARTERHLVVLDQLTEFGMVLVERLCDESRPLNDQLHAFRVLSASVRRSILLSHLIETNQLPKPRDAKPAPEPARAPSVQPPRADDRTRLDTLDCLDVLTNPIELTVAAITADIRKVLDKTFPQPSASTTQKEPSPAGGRGQGEGGKTSRMQKTKAPPTTRPEADNANLL